MKQFDNANQRILYLDEHLAVVYKNTGEICEHDHTGKSMYTADIIKPDIEKILGHPLSMIEAVHRIDQPVSGCLLLAFTNDVLAALTEQFKRGKTRKRYMAIVERRPGAPSEDSGRIQQMIRFDRKNRKARILPHDDPEAKGRDWKRASLSWSKAGEGDRYTFLLVTPDTGRTHQIRSQLSSVGFVIKGDLKYGARRSEPGGGIRLHAQSVQFSHPITHDILTVSSFPIDPDPLWSAFVGCIDGKEKV